MKQLLILSGKGGTGKTTISSAFIKLSNVKAYADCDVDAPNLHLTMNNLSDPEFSDYYGLPKASIDSELCIQCGLCKEKCRFEAVLQMNSGFEVNTIACEGCGVCEVVCPVNAMSLFPTKAGDLMLYVDDAVFSTAKLRMGSGTSGKLVSEVKIQMKLAAKNTEFAIIDGSPGIGCPVISSISGVDMVLVVAEPSISGISDLKRIVDTAKRFQCDIAVCINKADTNFTIAEEIKDYCKEIDVPFVGTIPFDPEVIKITNAGNSVTEVSCKAGEAINKVYDEIVNLLLH